MKYLALSITCLLLPSLVQAEADTALIEQRLSRIEQSLNNRSLLELLEQVEKLQTEVGRLQGEIEVQNHTITLLKNQQRKLYADMDERIQQLRQENTSLLTDGNQMPGAGVSEIDTAAAINLDNIANELDNSNSETEESLTQGDEITEQSSDTVDNADSEATAGAEATEPTATTPETSAVVSTELDPLKAQAEYQNAFRLLRQSKYDHAIRAFNEYLQTYADSDYADNAQYWLGETYYVTRDFNRAIEAYNKLILNYPDSNKLPQSLLKLGYSYQELGQIPEAETRLQELSNNYPGTTAARLAKERLQQLQSGSQG